MVTRKKAPSRNKSQTHVHVAGIILVCIIFPIIIFTLGIIFEKTKNTSYVQLSQTSSQTQEGILLSIEQINPYKLSEAPVPNLSQVASSTTTALFDENDKLITFKNGHVNLVDFFDKNTTDEYFADLNILGYTYMRDIPTAVTLVSLKMGSSGYFPYLVLYTASENGPKISQIIPIQGNRISLKKVLIDNEVIKIDFVSWGEDFETNFVYSTK